MGTQHITSISVQSVGTAPEQMLEGLGTTGLGPWKIVQELSWGGSTTDQDSTHPPDFHINKKH